MVKIIDRRGQALGTQAWNRPESAITTIVWHYTAVARRQRAFITGHENYWKNTLGWGRGGYHFYISANGNIYQNYNLTTRTNGAKNQNSHTVHISVEANSASDYSQAQINARQEITLWLMKRLNINANRVQGHKELPGQKTACPGYSTSQMNNFRKQLASGRPGKLETTTGGGEKAPKVAPTGQTLHLPASINSWNVYKPGGPYTVGNETAKLSPSKFGGLSYAIQGNPVKDVYLIKSGDFGVVAIYASKDTKATITGSGAGNDSTRRKTTQELVAEVHAGKHGNGAERKKSLGSRYQEVQNAINKGVTSAEPKRKSTQELVNEVMAGVHGSGADRKRSLGSRYQEVQNAINRGTIKSKPTRKTTQQLVNEVMAGVHGSGDDRKRSLGSRYQEVQKAINRGTTTNPKPTRKTTQQLVKEVLEGRHGSGADRKRSLGSRYQEVQNAINNISNPSRKSTKQLADEVMRGRHGSGAARKRSLGSRYREVQNYINKNY